MTNPMERSKKFPIENTPPPPEPKWTDIDWDFDRRKELVILRKIQFENQQIIREGFFGNFDSSRMRCQKPKFQNYLTVQLQNNW